MHSRTVSWIGDRLEHANHIANRKAARTGAHTRTLTGTRTGTGARTSARTAARIQQMRARDRLGLGGGGADHLELGDAAAPEAGATRELDQRVAVAVEPHDAADVVRGDAAPT
jgi:hypothetical protein